MATGGQSSREATLDSADTHVVYIHVSRWYRWPWYCNPTEQYKNTQQCIKIKDHDHGLLLWLTLYIIIKIHTETERLSGLVREGQSFPLL